MPGIQIVHKIRSFHAQDRRIGDVPIVLITVERPRDKIVTAVQAGANAFLVKPLTGEMLVKKLTDISKVLL